MTSGRTSGRSARADTSGAAGVDVAEQFQVVLETETRELADISHAGDFIGWRSRVVREVMDHRSPYALALRRGHRTIRQNEFLQGWQTLITETLERVAPGEACTTGDGPRAAPAATVGPEDLAMAILAALHGGATLSWLTEDVRSLEAALDIALAPVLAPREPDASGDQPPR